MCQPGPHNIMECEYNGAHYPCQAKAQVESRGSLEMMGLKDRVLCLLDGVERLARKCPLGFC